MSTIAVPHLQVIATASDARNEDVEVPNSADHVTHSFVGEIKHPVVCIDWSFAIVNMVRIRVKPPV